MSFKECQGLKALGAHLSPNFLLSAPPPRRGLGLSITEVVSYFPLKTRGQCCNWPFRRASTRFCFIQAA